MIADICQSFVNLVDLLSRMDADVEVDRPSDDEHNAVLSRAKALIITNTALQHARGVVDLRLAASACRICGCTETHACSGGCYWVEPHLCSACCFD